MPTRNLITIVLVVIFSIVCYDRTQRNRFAWLFAEAMDRVATSYVDEVDKRELFEGAMNGMLYELDRYSSYIGPEEYSEFKVQIDQEFGGIGIIVSADLSTKRLMVLSPVVGTPAYRAGLLAGDAILKVNGESIEGISLRQAVDLLRGIPGSEVHMTILHKGDDNPVEVKVTREIIQVPSVIGDIQNPNGEWEYVLKEDPQIGFLRLTTFGERTVDELETALDTLEDRDVIGLILDLRTNAGGLLTAATATCDMFIDQGVIVSTRGRDGIIQDVKFATKDLAVPMDLPMAVLINNYSASASEIVAGCLQDQDRAVIVGERSYGKGTVQNLIPLEMGKSVMKLTTATFWRPSNKNIHRANDAGDKEDWGVIPDEGYQVQLTPEQRREVELARNKKYYGALEEETSEDVEDLSETLQDDDSENTAEDGSQVDAELEDTDDVQVFEDPQLHRAVEYIQQQIAVNEATGTAA